MTMLKRYASYWAFVYWEQSLKLKLKREFETISTITIHLHGGSKYGNFDSRLYIFTEAWIKSCCFSYFVNMEQINYSVWLPGKENRTGAKICYFDQKISNGRLHFASSRVVRMRSFARNIMFMPGQAAGRRSALRPGSGIWKLLIKCI